MIRPDELNSDKPLVWSTGTGTDVWELFCACIAGDLAAVERLIAQRPGAGTLPLRVPQAALLRRAREPARCRGVPAGARSRSDRPGGERQPARDRRDRGYAEMEQLLETKLAEPAQHLAARRSRRRGDPRARFGQKCAACSMPQPELLHAGDVRSNQPIHWAVMTRQIELIDELLARGADINAQRFDGARPIQLTNGDYHYRGWRDVPQDDHDDAGRSARAPAGPRGVRATSARLRASATWSACASCSTRIHRWPIASRNTSRTTWPPGRR